MGLHIVVEDLKVTTTSLAYTLKYSDGDLSCFIINPH